MSGDAYSEDALLASLHDIELPVHAAGGMLADITAVLGLGAASACLVVWLLGRLTHGTAPQVARGETPTLEHIETLPEPRQRVALLRRLKARSPERFARYDQALYSPETISLADLKAEVAACD